MDKYVAFVLAAAKERKVSDEVVYVQFAQEELARLRGDRKARDPNELHNCLRNALDKLPPDQRIEFAKELKQFMEGLGQLCDVGVKLSLAVILAESEVSPPVIRELTKLVNIMNEEQIHVMHSPEALILITQKEAIKTGAKLNDLLLEKLVLRRLLHLILQVFLRAKRTNKSMEEARFHILHPD